MGKSKQTTKSSTNQTQTNTPFAPALPGLTDLAGQIAGATAQVQSQTPYSGGFVALPGQLQQQVIPAYQQAAATAGSLVDPATQAALQTNWQMPSFAGPGTEAGTQGFASYDPTAIQPVIEAAMAPYMRQLMEQVLPGLQSAGIESGAYSNDRALSTLPQMALRDTSRMAAEVGAGIGLQDFQNQQARQLEAFGLNTQRGLGEADVLTSRLGLYPALLDNIMRMSTGQASLTEHAAGYDTAMRQAAINDALARDAYAMQAPFRGLDTAASLYGTFAPYGTQNMTGTSKTTQTSSPSLGSQIMQGALGVGGMLLGSPGGLSMLGLGGTAAAGAGINPLLGSAYGGYTNPFATPSPYNVLTSPIPQFGVPPIGGY